MTELLEKVINRVKQLEASDQDAIATIILEELEDEHRWDTAFEKSHDLLAQIAAQAMEDYQAGNTEKLEPETL